MREETGLSNAKKKHGRRRKRTGRGKFLFIAIIVIAAVIVIIAAVFHKKENTGITGEVSETGQQETGLAFPYELEDGRLSVDSVFQFSGFNPDNGNEEGENIAALEVTNHSDQQLVAAEISVSLTDDRKFTFEVADVPAGQSVLVFEKENQTYGLNDICTEITDTAEFGDGAVRMEDRLSIQVEETTVTLTNHSEEELNHLLLHCHCLIDGSYFGGLTYTYPVESIPAGQNITVEAEDCYLGEAAVVRVSQDRGEE